MKIFHICTGFVLAFMFLASCSSPKQENLKKIRETEEILFSDETKMFDRTKARDLINKYTEFADNYPEENEAPGMLFKAGDLAMNLNSGRQAIQIFDRIIETYPDFEKASQCLFLKGYILENELGDLEEARKIYEEFLAKYPDDDFADDAEMSIRNLGKSPDELIREFEAKNQEQDTI